MEETPQPSLKKIIFFSPSTLTVVLFPLAAWFLLALLGGAWLRASVAGGNPARLAQGVSATLFLAVTGTAFAVLFVMLRMRIYRRLFSEGVDVLGRVTSASSWRGRTRIRYTYDYMGQTYKGGCSVTATPRAMRLRPGMEVVLIVDWQSPRHSVIREFFVEG